MRPALLAVALLAVSAAFGPTLEGQQLRPRLVVLLVVDQMRADYVDRFQHQWSRGLKRLLSQGATFANVAYPFANTVTCASHASVSTGALPAVHGMILNTWWDRDFGKVVACADDPSSTALSFGKPVSPSGESAARLLTPTLADALQRDRTTRARTAAFSLKARSAVTLAGERPDAVAWTSDQGAWITSTAYGGLTPEIARFVLAHPVEQQLWTVWDRARPASEYWYDARALGTRGDSAVPFPHPVHTWAEWEESPLSDAYLAQMALAVAGEMRFGRDNRTDYLAISFSALDLVGHDFGPQSHEVQDVLIRLDATIGDLLDGLDRQVGRGNYVVALTADHGVSQIPDAAERDGYDAGRIQPRAVTTAVQDALTASLGRGRWDVRVQNGNVYLDAEMFERLSAAPNGVASVRTALTAVPGIAYAYSHRDLTHASGTGDPILRSLAGSFMPGRSGDFVFVNKSNWLYGPANTATHGTPYEYDTRVPLMLFGAGIVPGIYSRAVTPLDIAPTLARLSGVELPDAQGQLLEEAVAPAFRPSRRLPVNTTGPSTR